MLFEAADAAVEDAFLATRVMSCDVAVESAGMAGVAALLAIAGVAMKQNTKKESDRVRPSLGI